MKNGFTLIELMVVMTIMGILGFSALANIGNFREDQTLKKGVSDLQIKLRAIQTNATTNTKCNGNSTLFWKGKFSKVGSAYKLETSCEYSGSVAPTGCTLTSGVVDCVMSDKAYTLEPGLEIGNISSGNCQVNSTNLSTNPVTVSFPALRGDSKFKYTNPAGCIVRSNLEIYLLNINTPGTLNTVVIDKGGSIYVKEVE